MPDFIHEHRRDIGYPFTVRVGRNLRMKSPPDVETLALIAEQYSGMYYTANSCGMIYGFDTLDDAGKFTIDSMSSMLFKDAKFTIRNNTERFNRRVKVVDRFFRAC